MSIEIELHRLILDAKWRCNVTFLTLPPGGKRFVRLTFSDPTGEPPPLHAGKTLFHCQQPLSLYSNAFYDRLPVSERAAAVFEDFQQSLRHAGRDENEDGCRTELDPVANCWQRRCAWAEEPA